MPSTRVRVVNEHLQFPKVSLVPPSSTAYLHIAAEVDARPAFLFSSKAKRELIEFCHRICEYLEEQPGVLEAVTFTALLIPPGRGRFVNARRDQLHVARFDFAVLIETTSAAVAERVQQSSAYRAMLRAIQSAASYVHAVTASNVRRIGSVDHRRDGVFLFNHFFADDTSQNLGVWEYTAGWFQHETGLDNSTVLLPLNPAESGYNLINHCRWDHLSDILPSLVFKPTFQSYVLDNFEANSVAAMPILYRLA